MSKYFIVPLIGARLRDWWAMLLECKWWSIWHLHKVLVVSLVISILSFIRLFTRKNKSTQTHKPSDPIFIIGHWRSGTTHLHNLLALDPQFAFINYHQGLFPHNPGNFFRRLMKWIMPKTRPMDNMRIHPGAAQEDELPLASLGILSFYNIWYFPKDRDAIFRKTVLMEDVDEQWIQKWKTAYRKIVSLALTTNPDKIYLSKNPAHTARIKLLMSMYPNARFVFIKRHLTETWYSTLKLYEQAVPYFQLQSLTLEQSQESAKKFYPMLMQKFKEEKHHIPPEHFVEVEFDSLLKDPFTILEKIYTQFGLSLDAALKLKIQNYLTSISSYQQNTITEVNSQYPLPDSWKAIEV